MEHRTYITWDGLQGAWQPFCIGCAWVGDHAGQDEAADAALVHSAKQAGMKAEAVR